jgi:hypothetical protein
LKRDACYGICPVYLLDIHSDGTARFVGERFVVEAGERRRQLTEADLQRIRSAIAQSGFMRLTPDCCQKEDWTGDATVTFEVHHDGGAQRIVHYHGCNAAPRELTVLEDTIDEIAGTADWIGPADHPERRWR